VNATQPDERIEHDDEVDLEHDDPTEASDRTVRGPWPAQRRQLDPLVVELLKAHREHGRQMQEAIVGGFDRMHDDLGGMHADLGKVPDVIAKGMRQGAAAVVIVALVAMVLVTSVVVGSVVLKFGNLSVTTQGEVAAPSPSP
jgi:hypothetical protein